ncbi:MAG TPA: alpha/beta hydrolase-fold protein, partial [Rhizomicrobium sp.]|nr:alpha/beta hydrolase-fold protein [Rhizomicrobium sp.]
MRNRTYASLLTAALMASLPALAQPAPELPKFPTPPPAVSAENSIIGPDYANPPESVAVDSVPQGDVREFILYSQDSKIYPGIVRVANMQRDARGNYVVPASGLSAPGPYERHVWVYIPRQLPAGKPAPFMVVQDGHSYVKRMANILDNMIAAKRLPAMVVILPDSGGSDAQGSERGLEYDTVSDRYSDWVESELLPAVSKNYGVTFTTDP